MAKKGRKKRNGLFRKYFIFGGSIIVVGFIIISLAIMVFVANQWWTDKVTGLQKNTSSISMIYIDAADKNGKIKNKDQSGAKTLLGRNPLISMFAY